MESILVRRIARAHGLQHAGTRIQEIIQGVVEDKFRTSREGDRTIYWPEGADNAGFGYYSRCKFREISMRVKLLAFWRWLGFEFLVNHFPRYRRFWEHYLCFVVRGKVMEFEFEVMK